MAASCWSRSALLISIPIVIWGSTLLLSFVEKYPAFVYVGVGRARLDEREDDELRAAWSPSTSQVTRWSSPSPTSRDRRRARRRLRAQSPHARVAHQRAHRPISARRSRGHRPNHPHRGGGHPHAQDPGSRRRLPQLAACRAPRDRRIPPPSRLRGAPAQRAGAVLAPRVAVRGAAATATPITRRSPRPRSHRCGRCSRPRACRSPSTSASGAAPRRSRRRPSA